MTSTTDSTKEELLTLGNKVKKRRQQLKLSQEEFSDRAGVHRTYISQFELGSRNPTYTTLVKIASALKLTLQGLLDTKL